MTLTRKKNSAKPIKQAARPILFPLAALYAALILPLSVLAMLGYLPLPTLANPVAHAYELIFGMALLVIAGYLFGQPKRWQLWLFIGLWLATRGVFFTLGIGWFTASLSFLTAAWLAYLTAPPFWRAKRWTNKSLAIILVAFALLAGLLPSQPQLFSQAISQVLLVIGGLIYFMGGRILTPLLASFWLARKVRSPNRVQPRLELAVLLLLALAFITTGLTRLIDLTAVTSLSLVLAGGLTWVRILRWQPWQFWPSKDLIFLFIGYGFLATSFLVQGLASVYLPAAYLASHSLFVGAMALLMVVVMARVSQIKAFKQLRYAKSLNLSASLILLAAVARLAAPFFPNIYLACIHLALTSWVVGFLILFILLLKCNNAGAKTAT